MNLTSLTLATTLRVGLMVGMVSGLYLAYESINTEAVFERTVERTMQAMDSQLATEVANTQCLHVPDEPTISALVNEGWLARDIVNDSPWQLGMHYQSSASGRVVSKVLTLTAKNDEDGDTLKALGHRVAGSWHYQGHTLSIQRLVYAPTHEVDRMEFDTTTACFAW